MSDSSGAGLDCRALNMLVASGIVSADPRD